MHDEDIAAFIIFVLGALLVGIFGGRAVWQQRRRLQRRRDMEGGLGELFGMPCTIRDVLSSDELKTKFIELVAEVQVFHSVQSGQGWVCFLVTRDGIPYEIFESPDEAQVRQLCQRLTKLLSADREGSEAAAPAMEEELPVVRQK